MECRYQYTYYNKELNKYIAKQYTYTDIITG